MGVRTTGLTKADVKVDGFDMSINIYADDQIFGMSKVIFYEGKKGASLESGKFPEAVPIKSFWLRSTSKTLKDQGKFVPGATTHSLLAGHDFNDTFDFISEILTKRSMRLGLNFADSGKNMAYLAKMNIANEELLEVSQCFVGIGEKLQAEIAE